MIYHPNVVKSLIDEHENFENITHCSSCNMRLRCNIFAQENESRLFLCNISLAEFLAWNLSYLSDDV